MYYFKLFRDNQPLQNKVKVWSLSILISFASINIISQEEQLYKYHVGTTPPGLGWQNPGFNDSDWIEGHGSIGYGDNKDTIVTGVTPSVYIRYNLKINNFTLSSITGLVINTDYDDGFIAYLNGKEIIRVNMDTTSNPDNLKTTIRSHEAFKNKYARLEGFFIETTTLKNCNFDTANILAFEIHNDSANGSDLAFSFNFNAQTSSNFNYWNDNYTQQIPLDSIDLPIVIIETDEYGYSFDSSKIATMGIINNDSGKYNKLTNICNDYSGLIKIKGRGQTSGDCAKPSFRIELVDSAGENYNTEIMGLPEENDFILYGPFADQSLIHNELIFNIGSKMGHYEPRTQFCELILNGRDMGLYVLTENIKRDKNRIDISKLTNTDNSGIDVTGGYIFKWDKDYSEYMKRVEMVYPSFDDITPEQETYIYGFLDKVDDVLYSNNFTDQYTGYKRYLDVESLADYMIINELTKNVDAYFYSCYMYKDRDDKGGLVQYGPLWDYDFSMGYSLWNDITTVGWQFNEPSKPPKIPIERVLQDTNFVNLFAERWHNYRQGLLKNDSVFNLIDNLVDTLKPNIDRNYEIWPIMGKINSLGWLNNPGSTYNEEISNLKTWLTTRLTWIDNNIDKIYKPLIIYTGVNTLFAEQNVAHCYPNPFNDYFYLSVNLDTPGYLKMDVYDISGRVCKTVNYNNVQSGKSDFRIDMTDIEEAGIYILKVAKDDIPIVNQRVVKVK